MNRRMKRLLLLLSIHFTASQVMAQKNVYQIRADSVRIYSGCDTAELIIENRTKDTLGFLFNKGKGRTEFRKLQLQTVGNNAIAITGQDTLQLGAIIKTTVDTLYTSGTTLYYRKTDGTVVTVPLNLNTWGDGRYDLLSTNAVTVPSGGSVPFASWPANKVVGYYAYTGTDMPVLSDQAFRSIGQKNYYDGLMFRNGTTGFDMAINWDGELQGPNGAFLRTKDDTGDNWSAWRELLFKDYADKKYVAKNTTSTTLSGPGWYRIANNGDAVKGATNGTRAYGHFIITDGTAGNHQTVEFIVSVLYNRAPIIQVISNGSFGTLPFAGIRVIKGETYEGNAVEILTTRPENLSVKAVITDNEQLTGWTLVNWQKITSSTGYNDGVPTGMTQMNFVLGTDVVEGTVESNGLYWMFNRNAGLITNAGYRTRSPLGLVGDYKINSTSKKVIWTMGDDNVTVNNFYGLGYDFGTQVTAATSDHQVVIASNGVITHRFNMNGGVSLTGDVKTTGGMTATGFYQSSLRSLKKDITLFNGDALNLIKGLQIMEFTYKDDKEENRHVGIIADDSDWHFSTPTHDKFDSSSAISITMKAVQELTEKLEALNKRIEELESAVNKANGSK